MVAFLQCAEAFKIHFLSFCSVQKREKLLFSGIYACGFEGRRQ